MLSIGLPEIRQWQSKDIPWSKHGSGIAPKSRKTKITYTKLTQIKIAISKHDKRGLNTVPLWPLYGIKFQKLHQYVLKGLNIIHKLP